SPPRSTRAISRRRRAPWWLRSPRCSDPSFGISEAMGMSSLEEPTSRVAGIGIGLTIAGLGILLLLDQTGLLGWHQEWSVWPFLLIVFGLARFAAPRPDGPRDGSCRIVIGVWFL